MLWVLFLTVLVAGDRLEPLEMTSPAYPFIAFSGIPSVSFRFSGRQVSWPLPLSLMSFVKMFPETSLCFCSYSVVFLVCLTCPCPQRQDKGLYPYFGTMQDTKENLNAAIYGSVAQVARAAGQMAGHMALRLIHDRLLRLSVEKYDNIIRGYVSKINIRVNTLQEVSTHV